MAAFIPRVGGDAEEGKFSSIENPHDFVAEPRSDIHPQWHGRSRTDAREGRCVLEYSRAVWIAVAIPSGKDR